jgi:GAF domain-containing protein
VPYDSATVLLLHDGYVEIGGGHGWQSPAEVVGLRFPVPGDNPDTVVLRERQPLILGDAPAAYPSFDLDPATHHIRSWLGVPLLVHERVIGLLAVDSTVPNYFTPEHARLASAFAGHVAVAIENARLFEAERAHAEELAAAMQQAQEARVAAETASQAKSALLDQIGREKQRADHLLKLVIPLGASLAGERDRDRLLKQTLHGAMQFCEGAALYLRTPDDRLEAVLARRDLPQLPELPSTEALNTDLYDAQSGEPRLRDMIVCAVLTGRPIHVPDAYANNEYDFAGVRAFDRYAGCHSTSFLAIPLKDSTEGVIGVLALVNAVDPASGQAVPFDDNLQELLGSYSRLAAVALEVYAREQGLRQEIRDLRIALDESRQARQVAEITETDYFQQLRATVSDMRRMLDGS